MAELSAKKYSVDCWRDVHTRHALTLSLSSSMSTMNNDEFIGRNFCFLAWSLKSIQQIRFDLSNVEKKARVQLLFFAQFL